MKYKLNLQNFAIPDKTTDEVEPVLPPNKPDANVDYEQSQIKTKDIKLKDGENILYPQTKVELLINEDGTPYKPITNEQLNTKQDKLNEQQITNINDVQNKLPLSGGTLTGQLNARTVSATWLQSTAITDSSTYTNMAVIDNNGWIYKRNWAGFKTDLGIANKADTTYVNTELGKKQDKLTENQNNNINSVPNKQDKLTPGENIKIENNIISALGGGIEEVQSLPTLDEEEYKKHKFYLYKNNLSFMTRVPSNQVNLRKVTDLPDSPYFNTSAVFYKNNCYMFTSGGDCYEYNLESKTVNKYKFSKPYQTINSGGLCKVDNIVYMFGVSGTVSGYAAKKVIKFNLDTKELYETKDNYGKGSLSSSAACAYNNKCYIFCKNEIYEYNPATDSIILKGNQSISSSIFYSAILVGDWIYVFSPSNAFKYNPFTGESKLVCTYPKQINYTSVANIDNNFYIFGGEYKVGYSHIKTSDITQYNLDTNTFTKVANFVSPRNRVAVCSVDGKCYAFGGHGDVTITDICELSVGYTYSLNTLSTGKAFEYEDAPTSGN